MFPTGQRLKSTSRLRMVSEKLRKIGMGVDLKMLWRNVPVLICMLNVSSHQLFKSKIKSRTLNDNRIAFLFISFLCSMINLTDWTKLNVFENDVSLVGNCLYLYRDWALQPIWQKLFWIADQEVNFSRRKCAAHDRSDSNDVELPLDDNFGANQIVKCSSHEFTDEDILEYGLCFSHFVVVQVR